MNRLWSVVLVCVMALGSQDVWAKRLGGGGSTGMQRSATPSAPAATPAAKPQQAAAPQAQPKRSWMGPIAGLAAGLGLAALASHLGFGEELANFMMIALLGVVVIAAIGFFMRKKAGAPAHGMQYAGAGAPMGEPAARPEFTPASGVSSPAPAATVNSAIPADFDAEAFARTAKVNFIRLQAANDAGNLDDIREFTTPEMFAEIKMAIGERNGAAQETDVVSVEARVLEVVEENSRYIVSVHFSGQIREERNGPVDSFSEVWHMTKPVDGSRGWVIAGIQQVQ